MDEVYVNIKRDTELSNKFKKDFISIEEFFNEYYEVVEKNEKLEQELAKFKKEASDYDDYLESIREDTFNE